MYREVWSEPLPRMQHAVKVVRQYALHKCGCPTTVYTPVKPVDTPKRWEQTPEGLAMMRAVEAIYCPKCSAL